MSDNKDLSIEELMAIAKLATQAPVEQKIGEIVTEAQQFAIDSKFKNGDYKIRSAVVYEMYKQWKNNKNYQKSVTFLKDFGKLFKKWQNSSYIYYLVDVTDVNIPVDIIKSMRDPILRPSGSKTEPKATNVTEEKKETEQT